MGTLPLKGPARRRDALVARYVVREAFRSAERVEPRRPVQGARQIGALRGGAGEAPGAVVGGVARTARGGLDLRPLPPLVEARDRDHVGTSGDRGRPEPVVRRAVPPRTGDKRRLAGAYAAVARSDARRAEK